MAAGPRPLVMQHFAGASAHPEGKRLRVVATMSVKGGVGKSTIAANLALEAARRGRRVGVLDADLDSPFLVEMAGVAGKVGLRDVEKGDRTYVPVQHRGLRVMSFALWHPGAFQGATMRGEMHTQWLSDVAKHTDWGLTELLVVDLPAGSADEVLALADLFPGKALLGLVLVGEPNHPQGVRRCEHVASHHRIPILGVIENKASPELGSGGVEAVAGELGLRFLGRLPLDKRVRVAHEAGTPDLPADLMMPVRTACDAVFAAAGWP